MSCDKRSVPDLKIKSTVVIAAAAVVPEVLVVL